MKYPEEIKAYNKRHSVEVKVALDVLRQYVIGLDSVKDRHEYPCDYCIMENVCFELLANVVQLYLSIIEMLPQTKLLALHLAWIATWWYT